MGKDSSKKLAIVTGGARGIGLSIANRFYDEGFHVIILDRDKTSLELTRTTLTGKEGIECIYCDVSIPDQVLSVFNHLISKYHRIDALINNAGIAIFKKAEELTFGDWTEVCFARFVKCKWKYRKYCKYFRSTREYSENGLWYE